MAKTINNLPSSSPFIPEESVTINRSKNGRNSWMILIFMYLQQAYSSPAKKVLATTFSRKRCEGVL